MLKFNFVFLVNSEEMIILVRFSVKKFVHKKMKYLMLITLEMWIYVQLNFCKVFSKNDCINNLFLSKFYKVLFTTACHVIKIIFTFIFCTYLVFDAILDQSSILPSSISATILKWDTFGNFWLLQGYLTF